MEWLLNQKDVIQIFANIAIILTMFFTIVQLNRAVKEYKVKNQTEEAKESIELTKYYMDNILDDIGLIRNSYKEVGLEEIFKKINYSMISEFDIDELNDIFSVAQIKEIENKLEKINMEVYKKIIHNTKKTKEEIAATIQSFEDKNLHVTDQPINISRLNAINVKTAKNNVLNELEYFSMKFNVNIADEELVYQSLHQTYLSVVKLLYYDICNLNKKDKDKYYVNIILLYNKWSKRYAEASAREKSYKDSLIKKPKKIKK